MQHPIPTTLKILTMAALFSVTATCTTSQNPAPREITGAVDAPVADRSPKTLTAHGHERIDPYYWLKERENPEVIDYLEAENAYAEAAMAPLAELREELYEEMVGRIEKSDESVPVLRDGYYYYTRWEDDDEYPIHCRKKGSLEAEEEILLDVNELAEGHEYFAARGLQVSTGANLLTYATDDVGRRIYTLRIRDLEKGEDLADEIPEVTGSSVWANDNRTLFYTKQDPQTLRSHQVWRHVVGTDPAEDELIYREDDETFSVWLGKTKSKRFVVIYLSQTLSTEIRLLDAEEPMGEFQVFLARERDHEYSIDHHGEYFYVRTNRGARNFKLMRTPVGATGIEHWEEVIPHRDDVFLQGIELFKDHLVLTERQDGLLKLRIRPWGGGEEHYLDFGEPAYVAFPIDNAEFDTRELRYVYSSMTTPRSTYDYDMVAREKTLLKRQKVLGAFDPADYVTERLHAQARDGASIPISIVYRKGLAKDGSRPLLLYGYGSYGVSLDASFSSSRLSLLDRGFAYAIAHVRGGQELGREWYEDGKLFNKMNTFTDFIDAAEYLIDEGYTRSRRIYAVGGSAGGLLVGAVINLRPDLFDGVVARVPFVDVVTTMLDPSIPLTTGEYDEWGDPNDPAYYEYLLEYSPYDNVAALDYPNLLVTTGLHDSQVQYWEPAKWVAKLRTTKTGDGQLLLVTNMDAGHGGVSGRYKRFQETARYYAWLLDLAGRHEQPAE